MTFKAGFAIAAAVALAGCEFDLGPADQFKTDFHYSYDLNPGGRLDVETFNGAVDIDAWDQNKVEISGTKYGSSEPLRDAIHINVAASPDSITVRAERPSDLHGSSGARFTIHAPKSAVVGRVTSSNGPIHVSGVNGDGRLKTSNGGIHVDNLRGSLDAQTSNGPIEATAIRGDAILHTSNGRITAENVQGDVEATTSNGGIKVNLDQSPLTPVKLETSNGSIDFTMREKPKADIRATTVNSGITVQLPADTAARLSATTSNGSISSDFDLAIHGVMPKNHVEAAIGGGGPMITLVTSNGPIRIVKGAAQ